MAWEATGAVERDVAADRSAGFWRSAVRRREQRPRRQGVRFRMPPHAGDAARGTEPSATWWSAIDQRTGQDVGYVIGQRKRKRIEECFGWLNTVTLLRKVLPRRMT